MAYTPGPWTAGASLVSTWTREKQDRGEPITEIALVRERVGLGPKTWGEHDANVLLIAAAPCMADLLAECRTLLSQGNIFPSSIGDEVVAKIDALLSPILDVEER